MKAYSRNHMLPLFLLLTLILLVFTSAGFASSNERSITTYEINKDVVRYTDQLPQPVGGYESLISKVDYPELALDAKLEGNVLARIKVDDNGNVENVELLKTLGGGCDEAVINAIKGTKFWYSAALSEGMPRINQVSILFRFSLHNQ